MALQGFIKSRAYLVGIDEYAAPVRKLHTAVNDVKAIASCLPDFDNIAPPFQNPTVEDFKKILGRIIEEVNDEANPADRVFIYFAGHGKVVYNKENTPKGYLLFKNRSGSDYDSCSFAIEDLIKALETLQCRHLLLVLDCCFSGVVQWAINSRFTGHKDGLRITDPLYRLYTKNNAWQVITSSSYNQETIDSWGLGNRNALDGETNSPFAGIFINALSGVKKNEYFRNNIISSRKLHDYLTTELTGFLKTNKLSHEQSPGIFSLLNDKQGQFVFSVMSLAGKALPFDFEEIQFTNPYKGLQYYNREDAAYFFGRDEQIRQFEAYAAEDHDFFVTGPSGIGKSSLVRAGFIPRLHIPEENIFITRVANCGSILEKVKSAAATNKRAVVFIDQFEEILTFKKEDPVIGAVNEIIRKGLAQKNLYLIVAARSDKAYQLFDAEHIELERDQLKEIYVSHPNAGEIEDIIVRPALKHATVIRSIQNEHRAPEHININADKAFLQRIVQNYSQPGNLPFLSTAMYHWFRHSVHEADEPRMLKQSNWEKFADIEDVFNQIMEEVEAKHGDRFRQFMFRAVEYNTVNNNKTTNKPLRRSFARRDIGIEDPTLYLDLENARVIRQTGTEKKEETSGTETETYELAHDSIIEKWLVNKSWFKERKNKEQVINAHNAMLLSLAEWEKKGRKSEDLWHKNGSLGIIWKDYVSPASDKDSLPTQLRSLLFLKTRVPEPTNRYYTDTEKTYVTKSIQRKRIAAKFPVRMIALALFTMIGVATIYVQAEKRKKQIKDKVANLVERSKKMGETEALFLLKEAEKLSPGDSSISNALYSLLNERDYVGNPFAISVANTEDILSDIRWNTEKSNMHLYYSTRDSIEWKYMTSQIPGPRKAPRPFEGKNIRFYNGMLAIQYKQLIDTLRWQGESTVYFKLAKSGDSLFVVTYPDQYGSACKLYNYVFDASNNKFALKKVSPLAKGKPSISPRENYIYQNAEDTLVFYDFSGRFAGSIPLEAGENIYNLQFSEQEDKALLEFMTPEQGHTVSYSLQFINLKPGAKQLSVPAITGSTDGNFIFRNDSSVVYFDNFTGIHDSADAACFHYTEFNTRTGKFNTRLLFIPKRFNLYRSFIPCANSKGFLLQDRQTNRFVLADSSQAITLDYEGNFIEQEVIHNSSKTLFVIKSKQANLYLYTIYDITGTPVLIHKSSFSFFCRKAYCDETTSLLAMEFDNRVLAVFDLKKNLRINAKLPQRAESYTGFVEIPKDSLVLYSDSYIYTGRDFNSELYMTVLSQKGIFLFCNEYDSIDDDIYQDSAMLYNAVTGSLTPIKSDNSLLQELTRLSGFRFKRSDDTVYIDLPKQGWKVVYPRDDRYGDSYFPIIAGASNYFFRYPSFIKIMSENLVWYSPGSSIAFNEKENAAPYSHFSDISMPADSIVTGILHDSALNTSRFFYWNTYTGRKLYRNSPSSTCPFFSIAGSSQILFADDNSLFLYDFANETILFSVIKANRIQNLFPLSDGLRYITIDGKNNLYSEFLPQKVKQVAYSIKTPELAYLR